MNDYQYYYEVDFYYPQYHQVQQLDTIFVQTRRHKDSPGFYKALIRHIKNVMSHDPNYTGGEILLSAVKSREMEDDD
jgi:hypothetical protein